MHSMMATINITSHTAINAEINTYYTHYYSGLTTVLVLELRETEWKKQTTFRESGTLAFKYNTMHYNF